jgi:hypothetical protein
MKNSKIKESRCCTAGTKHVQLVNLTVGFGRGPGIDASGVDNVLVLNCTVYGLGTSGVDLSGTNSGERTPFKIAVFYSKTRSLPRQARDLCEEKGRK